ncbi:MAG TPA: type II secretion system F family protein [Desulfobacterales bacterium]|nr:type II secretion system F family protein [Desulfobacterales bacterium]
MNILFLGVIIFIMVLFVIELSAYAVRMFRYPDRAEIRKRLRKRVVPESDGPDRDLIKKKILRDVPFLNQLLRTLPGVDRLDLLMLQANVKYTMGFFLLLSLALGFGGYLFVTVLTRNLLLALALGAAAAALPYLSLRSKKNKRMVQFEKQLPEALGLIARALRAGHAFASGMKLAAEEFVDPLGPEFEETLDEINFGVSVADALKNLAVRVECPDLKFFVVSVILQRETGGNLAEIIEGLAHLMRERFRFRGKVRTLTAEGRFSGKVLVALPLVVFVGLFFMSPDHAGHLIHDPLGRAISAVTIGLMVVGGLVIKRIIKLDV